MSPQKKTGSLAPATEIMIDGLEILLHVALLKVHSLFVPRLLCHLCNLALMKRPHEALHAGIYGVTFVN